MAWPMELPQLEEKGLAEATLIFDIHYNLLRESKRVRESMPQTKGDGGAAWSVGAKAPRKNLGGGSSAASRAISHSPVVYKNQLSGLTGTGEI